MIDAIHKLLAHDVAGDPIKGLKWTSKTTAKIAAELARRGIDVSAKTVARLLRKMDFSLKVNHKRISAGPPDRDERFEFIAKMRNEFVAAGLPVISVDAKKKELIGNFKNAGTSWAREPEAVNAYDFPSLAEARVTPYGVYDTEANLASVFVGVSRDTPVFAVNSIEQWWRFDGRYRYADTDRILILADSGGSNGPRNRAWLHGLQEKLCDRHGIAVTVCHYPPGTSKWNPIEHRVFSEISKNWRGVPLRTVETVLNYISSTTTVGGLRVKSYLDSRLYPVGIRISDVEMSRLCITPNGCQRQRSYTISPRENRK